MIKAEYIGLDYAMKYAIWTRKLLADAQQDEGEITILRDNKPSLNLIWNPRYYARFKHIDVQHYFICDELKKGTVRFKYCSTENILADSIIKLLARLVFEDKRKKLGIVEVNVKDYSWEQVQVEWK